jgi:DNA-binding NarL/FixJ family response regulator
VERRVKLLGFICSTPQYTWLATKGLAKKALASLQSRIDADAFQQALNHGATLDLPQAIKLAEAILAQSIGEPAPAAVPTQRLLLDALSERELDVLRLIAGGLTNAEIAGQLYIGVSTVKKHINHIYDKLDVKTRTQAVARAREREFLP